jgi:hypothetical protein
VPLDGPDKIGVRGWPDLPRNAQQPEPNPTSQALSWIAARLEARAFLFEDPGSFRAGVQESLRAVRESVASGDLEVRLDGGPSRSYPVTDDGELLRLIESF